LVVPGHEKALALRLVFPPAAYGWRYKPLTLMMKIGRERL